MKAFLRKILRFFCTAVKIRGRHKMAFHLGKRLMPKDGKDQIRIGEIKLPIDHNIPMYRYVYYGIYEEEFVAFLNRTIRPGDTVIDPGTNVGYISAVLSKLVGEKGKVFSIEPSRKCYNMLTQYLKAGNITLLNSALYKEETVKKFVDKENVVSNGYAAFNEYTGQKEGDDAYDIETLTVQGIVQKYNIDRIRFLKLDIEGAEEPALLGCGPLLAEHRIDYVLVESNFIPGHDKINHAIEKLLRDAGYKPFMPTRKKLVAVNPEALKGKRLDIIWTYLPG